MKVPIKFVYLRGEGPFFVLAKEDDPNVLAYLEIERKEQTNECENQTQQA